MKKTHITIAIVALNEERNIGRLLKSILVQKQVSFIIDKILIISDGSRDNTVKIAKTFRSSKLKIVEKSKRLGKSARLNEIYKNLSSEVLVQLDADVVLWGSYVIENLIQPLIRNKEVAMCGGNPIPKKGKTLIEDAVYVTCQAYLEFRRKVKGGNNVFSADGRILAFKKELVKKIYIPENMIANDMFAYFSCLSFGYDYRFIEKAKVNYYNPKTIADHIKQNTRFRASPIRMKNYFKESLVERELKIPEKIYLLTHLKYFVKSPSLSFFIFLLNRYCEIKAIFQEKKLNGIWDIAYSTKYFNSKLT